MFDLGDPIPLSVSVKDSTGALAAAGAIVLTVTLPDGTSSTPTVTNPSTGVYTATGPSTQAGRYGVRWVATGLNASAYTDAYDVDEAAPSALVSMADARAQLNLMGIDTSNDEELRFHVDTSSAVIQDIIGPVVRQTIVEIIPPQSGLLFAKAPVISLTTMTDTYGYGYTYNVANFLPSGKMIRPLAYVTPPCYPVTVTYVGGMAIVPPQIRMAALDLMRINWRPQQGGNYSAFDETTGEPMSMRLGYFVPNSIETGLLRAFDSSGVA